jgi:hypothetical protein
MRFSGHETFSCRTNWLNKGVRFCMNEASQLSDFSAPHAPLSLGVGKNMSISIRYWLEAFGIILQDSFGDDLKDRLNNQIIQLFYGEGDDDVFDPYLEDPFTLWYLHYKLASTQFAGMYHFFYYNYFPRKASEFFTEEEFLNSLKSYLRKEGHTVPSDKTLSSDFGVFIDMYCIRHSTRDELDDVGVNILQSLGILSRTANPRAKNGHYFINKSINESIPDQLLAFVIQEYFETKNIYGRSVDLLLEEVGRPFLFYKENFHTRVRRLADLYPEYFSISVSRNTGISEFEINPSLSLNSFQFVTK